MTSPEFVASECCAALFAQNTLSGFRHCLDVQADGIEFDVHLSADGHVVVQHDYLLNKRITREANGQWLPATGDPVCTLTLAQLQEYDVGRYAPGAREAALYPDYQPIDGEPIPTFQAFVDAYIAAQSSATLWVELKTSPFDRSISSDPHQLLAAVLDVVQTYHLVQKTVLLAFEWDVLLRAAEQCPGIGTDFLTINETYTRSIYRNRPDIDPTDIYGEFRPADFDGDVSAAIAAANGQWWGPYIDDVTRDDVASAQNRGLKVNVWGVASTEQAVQQALQLEPDAVTLSDLRLASRG